MPNMELIGGPTGGQISSSTASITFSNIPQTYTDLKLVISARNNDTNGAGNILMGFNGSTSSFTNNFLQGSGSGTPGSSSVAQMIGDMDTAAETANTFNNIEVYIPNYTSNTYKSFISDSVMENNANPAYQMLTANLWSNVSPITSIEITNRSAGKSFVSGSTFYLYGISNVTSGSKATGGIVSSDGTYWYHMFPFSSTFTPTTSINADILCIAGGGAGGSPDGWYGGGGGAGGLQLFSSQALTATGYSVTVGAGGAGSSVGGTNGGNNGGNSQFASLTASVGGGGGMNVYNTAGSNGGSGGGGGRSSTAGGTPTSGQGNSGGAGAVTGGGGGGGGAGSVGGVANTSSPINYQGGVGGIGVNTYSSWAGATQTGDQGYYAGGGGANGANEILVPGGLGGGGIGAAWQTKNAQATSGKANTGGGGGGVVGGNQSPYSAASGSGGSGIIIVRYAV